MSNECMKYETRIEGLDSLLYGGLYLDDKKSGDKEKGLLLLARGEHGVNKVHLAMQICEGLFISKKGSDHGALFSSENETQNEQSCSGKDGNDSSSQCLYNIPKNSILFISINKDKKRLRDTYIGFFIQRLINDARTNIITFGSFVGLLKKFEWKRTNNNPGGVYDTIEATCQKIIDNIVFYDDRIHCLCKKTDPSNNDYMTIYELLLDETEKKMDIHFRGKDDFTHRGNEDSLDVYERMLDMLKDVPEKKDGQFRCIMIDGLSRLSKHDIDQISFSELTNLLRDRCDVGVITADTKIAPTAITVDVVIDMIIREEHHPDCIQYALKISKCLFQKNVYGWHSYKMRRTGIEIIPSIHFQMNSRFHMDNAVHDATYEYNEIPFDYYLKEGGKIEEYNEKGTENGKEKYEKIYKGSLYAISVRRDDDGSDLFAKIANCFPAKQKDNKDDHFLIIDLSRTRKEFYDIYSKQIDEIFGKKFHKGNLHLFNFRPGHIHDDDFLYTIEKQAKAIARTKEITGDDMEKKLEKIHIVLGDINYINFAYPCLNHDGLLLPAFLNFTKRYHMKNFIYTTACNELSILEKEKELYQQLKIISHYFIATTNNPILNIS